MVRQRVTVRVILYLLLFVLIWLCLFTGTVDIPCDETWKVLTGGSASKSTWHFIITQLRIPAAITAALCGAALGVAGLLLQTTFNNTLAGPSILGVSTGASMGVAIVTLAFPGVLSPDTAALTGAAVGAAIIILLLLGFSLAVRSAMMLLIVGIMLSYLTSSAISILNFYATQEGVHSFVIWGMGNFTGTSGDSLIVFVTLAVVLLGITFFLSKPLNAMLLGERYADNTGVNVRRDRFIILAVSGALIAVVTAYCGPIGFIGLAIPHIARLLFHTSNHRILIPQVILTGAITGLLTLWICGLPGDRGMLPVNAITPIIGIPVVLYIILNRRRISYFN